MTHADPQRSGPGDWEVVQQVIPESGESLVFAFSHGAAGPMTVWLRGIQPEVSYELRSSDRGRMGQEWARLGCRWFPDSRGAGVGVAGVCACTAEARFDTLIRC